MQIKPSRVQTRALSVGAAFIVFALLGIAPASATDESPPAQWQPSPETTPPTSPPTPPPPPSRPIDEGVQYGAQVEAGFVAWDSAEIDESQVYLDALPHVSYEGSRFSVGGAARVTRYEIGDEPIDRARLEVTASVQLHKICDETTGKSCPWKVRLIGYLASADVNVGDESRFVPGFDPSGRTDSYGFQARLRKQTTPYAAADGIYWRSSDLPDVALGFRHFDDSAEGEEVEANGWTTQVDARVPAFRDKLAEARGLFTAAVAYTEARYDRSAVAPDHLDTYLSARLGYEHRLFRERDKAMKTALKGKEVSRWELLAAVQYANVDSKVPVFNGTETLATVGIRWVSPFPYRQGVRSTPGNEDSGTTSPADLGPSRPQLGNP
jgi:hypothetical protein